MKQGVAERKEARNVLEIPCAPRTSRRAAGGKQVVELRWSGEREDDEDGRFICLRA
ncbi:hypothetical protein PM082_010009 [Marasmius tenuissimus]|nr:hypothetical protein PM082_010009 [Marasmius tenuissimus]